MVVAASVGHYQAIAPPALGRKQWIGSWPRLAVDGPAAAARMAKKFDLQESWQISQSARSRRALSATFLGRSMLPIANRRAMELMGGHVFWPTSKTSRRKAYASGHLSELGSLNRKDLEHARPSHLDEIA